MGWVKIKDHRYTHYLFVLFSSKPNNDVIKMKGNNSISLSDKDIRYNINDTPK